jgi:hypothetical protein
MPAPLPDPHVGDVGVEWIATFRDESNVVIDVSTATLKTVTFRKPDAAATEVEKNAVFDTDGTDGKIKYVGEAGFQDVGGMWEYWGYVELASGLKWHTRVYRVFVTRN